MKVKRALISVSDKTGVVELGKALADTPAPYMERPDRDITVPPEM